MHERAIYLSYPNLIMPLAAELQLEIKIIQDINDSSPEDEQSDQFEVDGGDTSQETRSLCRHLGRHYRIPCTSNADRYSHN